MEHWFAQGPLQVHLVVLDVGLVHARVYVPKLTVDVVCLEIDELTLYGPNSEEAL